MLKATINKNKKSKIFAIKIHDKTFFEYVDDN